MDGETDGASACISGDGVAAGVVATDGVELATGPAGGVGVGGTEAALGVRGGGHTWLKETVGGCVPVPTE
jgi:hypothetical protein